MTEGEQRLPQASEGNEGEPPAQNSFRRPLIDALVAVCSLALLIPACVGGVWLGMHANDGGDTGSILLVLPLGFLPFQILFAINFAMGNYRRTVACVVLLLLDFGVCFVSGPNYGNAQRGSNASRQKVHLQQIAGELESYAAEKGAYPSSLADLKPGYWQTQEKGLTESRYLSTPGGWLLWCKGHDGKWNLEASEATKKQWSEFVATPRLSETMTSESWPSFLVNATYDPTNGGYSSGDIVRYGPDTIWRGWADGWTKKVEKPQHEPDARRSK